MKHSKVKTAIQKIEDLQRIGKEVAKSAPDLERLKETFNVIHKYDEQGIPLNRNITEIYNDSVESISELNILNYNHSVATGAAAMIVTNASDYLIHTEGPTGVDYQVINNIYKAIIPSDKEEKIRTQFTDFGIQLNMEFDEVVHSYNSWKNETKSDSDLAKDMRTLLEHFKGYLKIIAGQKGRKSFSWEKTFESICDSKSAIRVAFLKQKSLYQHLHQELTKITKKMNPVESGQMESHYNNVLDHISSILDLIDISKVKKT